MNENLTYTLHLENGKKIYYKPHLSTLIDEHGSDLYKKNPIGIEKINDTYVYSVKDYYHSHEIDPIHPLFNPGKKTREVGRLKIQLGLKCNYKCEYCSQSSFVSEAVKSNNEDLENFIDKLDTWFPDETCHSVEFWGGEPLLYWNQIKILTPLLVEKWGELDFTIVTNGSLLTQEKVDFFEKYKFSIAMSHDGPGYHLRGPDPLDNPKKYALVKQLIQKSKEEKLGFSFSIVWTKENSDYEKTVEWFKNRMEDPNVPLNAEGVVEAYDIKTALNEKTGMFNYDYLQKFEDGVYEGCTEGSKPLLKIISSVDKINEFFATLLYKKTWKTVGQKCGMDRDDELAVDLKGNVLTCQNVGLERDHLVGHLDNLEEARIKSSQHWTWRSECSHCPVIQLCQGSCMFLKGQEFAQTCWNEYAYNMGHFKAAIKMLTGQKVMKIEGKQNRPAL